MGWRGENKMILNLGIQPDQEDKILLAILGAHQVKIKRLHNHAKYTELDDNNV